MDYGQIIHRTFDDSYVITKNSMSYHVPNEGEFAEEWAEVRAYAEAHPECVVVEQPYVPPVPTLEELKAAKKARIDAETSAAILAGFDYAVDGVNYHFSYALDDQQNFSDTANVCLMKQSGMLGLPDSVTWNAYTPDDELVRLTFDASGFFALYAGGAMRHKNETMQRGGERKAAVEAAATPDEIAAV
ncbi:MAG: hypothetical protein HPZ84_14430 [Desulfovibrionaceae bacterium]|nr:hypothetical protein [Desulfovibrionaceae bacterium]